MNQFPEALACDTAELESPSSLLTPLPSSFPASTRHLSPSSPLLPVICDERAISRLLEHLLERAGLTPKEAAVRLGYRSQNSVRQYLAGRRTKPSLIWFIRFCQLCGAQVTLTFPHSGTQR